MNQLDLLADPCPTLLRMSSWLGREVIEESQLPFMPGDYKVSADDDRWTVACLNTQAVIYRGIGPVEVVRRSAPHRKEERDAPAT
jgi:hypothetical protein